MQCYLFDTRIATVPQSYIDTPTICCILYSFWDIGRGNDNLGWSDLQMSSNMVPIESSCMISYSNFSHTTHRFRDTSCFIAENHIFAHPTCIWCWIWRSCRGNMETKFGIRKPDRFTITKTALCIASHGKNCRIRAQLLFGSVSSFSFSSSGINVKCEKFSVKILWLC